MARPLTFRLPILPPMERGTMLINSIKKFAVIFAVAALCGAAVLLASAAAQQPTAVRKILLKVDAPVPGYEQSLAAVEIPVGAREGRHTHPGSAMVFVQEGTLTLDIEGKPSATYKPGDTAYIEPDKIHEGRNNGSTNVKIIAVFLLKKGLPMTTQVK